MKITIVSFVPWEMKELKPGVIPTDFLIPAGDPKNEMPSVLVIEDAITNIYMGAERGTFPSPVPVEQLANSIVNDSVSAHIDIDTDAKPALFWVPGEFTAKQIKDQFPDKCRQALDSQKRWGMKLIKSADDSWARFRQHRMVTDPQRVFANLFGFTKEWAIAPEPVTFVKCPACTTLIESTAVVCKNCRAILKADEAKKLGITFAATA